MNNKTRYMATVGMLSAFAYILAVIGHFVPIYFNDFLKYDPKDAIIVMAGFALGPVSSIIISVIVAFLELITISTTGVIGFAMNIISSVAFATIAAFVYKYRKTIGGAVCGLILSSAVTVGAMILWNYLVTPIYMGVPRDIVAGMLLTVFLPFNVIKCGLNGALTMLIYKPCVQAMRRIGLIRVKSTSVAKRPKSNLRVAIPSLVIMVIMVILFIIFKLNS